MSATLTPTTDAAFPDRSGVAAGVEVALKGLRVQLQPGGAGAYLEHVFSSLQPVIHVRFCFRPGMLAGGSVALCRALGATDMPAFTVRYDPTTRQLTVTLGNGQSLTATLSAPIAWHVVEVGLNTSVGEARLWINGVQADQTTGVSTASPVACCRLGAFFQETAAIGEFALDEWVMATDYIGVVTAAPTSNFADDPARWLVIHNLNNPDSITWAEHYRAARGVPYANLLGLPLSADETMDGPAFETMRNAILDYLSAHALADQMVGLLLGYGVPGYVEPDAPGLPHAIPALLHRPDGQFTAIGNPLACDAVPVRPTAGALRAADLRLTARIDATDLAAALALVDRGTALHAGEPLDADDGVLYVDPYSTPGGLVENAVQRLTNWISSVDRLRTRLPLQLPALVEPSGESQFSAISHDGFFWGWGPELPPDGFFAEPAGLRVFCLQLEPEIAAAPTLRAAVPNNWAMMALRAGYAATAGAALPYSASDVPLARPFFEALRRGWTLGEAWLLACPYLRQGLFLIGDPLLQLSFPRAGWDVYGPLPNLEAIDWSEPLAVLGETELALRLSESARLVEGDIAVFALQHRDEQGRPDRAARTVRITTVKGAAQTPPLSPVWPDVEAWPLCVEGGRVRATLLAGQPLTSLGVTQVELIAQDLAQGETVIAAPVIVAASDRVQLDFTPPVVTTRYRWRLQGSGGAVVRTPWSSWITPPPPLSLSLTDLIVES